MFKGTPLHIRKETEPMKLDKVYTEDRQLIVGKNDLKTWCEQNPEIGKLIIKEWNSKENGSMTSYKAGSYKKAAFRCCMCGKPYEKIIRNRVLGGLHEECGRKIGIQKSRHTQVSKLGEEKNLAIQYPDIAKEWDYSRNKGICLSPEYMSINSPKKVWWKCGVCHTSYQKIIKMRTLRGYGCNVCKENFKRKANGTIID